MNLKDASVIGFFSLPSRALAESNPTAYALAMAEAPAGWTRIETGYAHETGVRLRKLDYAWKIVGGKEDGNAYGRLWVAMSAAVGTPAAFIL